MTPPKPSKPSIETKLGDIPGSGMCYMKWLSFGISANISVWVGDFLKLVLHKKIGLRVREHVNPETNDGPDNSISCLEFHMAPTHGPKWKKRLPNEVHSQKKRTIFQIS